MGVHEYLSSLKYRFNADFTFLINNRLRKLGDHAELDPFRPLALRRCLSTGLPFLAEDFLFAKDPNHFPRSDLQLLPLVNEQI
jgi:hypothetical protein